jgi:hypothetical protein
LTHVALILCMAHNLDDLHIRGLDPPLVSTWAALFFAWKQTGDHAFGKLKFLDVSEQFHMVHPPVALPAMKYLRVVNYNIDWGTPGMYRYPFKHPNAISQLVSQQTLSALVLDNVGATPNGVREMVSSPWLVNLEALLVYRPSPLPPQTGEALAGLVRALETHLVHLEKFDWTRQEHFVLDVHPKFDTFVNLRTLRGLHVQYNILRYTLTTTSRRP